MDDDDLRRGRPTLHIKYDEATAILAGDALLAQAFAHLADNVDDPMMVAESIRVLGRAAGPTKLVGGQADDLSARMNLSYPKTKNLNICNRSTVVKLEHCSQLPST